MTPRVPESANSSRGGGPICPDCAGLLIPIAYGYGVFDSRTFKPGGCKVYSGSPEWHCSSCQIDYTASSLGLTSRLDESRMSPAQQRQRWERDLDDLRALAWLVKQGRYIRELPPQDGERRGAAQLRRSAFYASESDWDEAVRAVQTIKQRQAE